MKTVPFFPWAESVSVLGYGTTSFMSADTTKERLALLECALDSGITHFDTAAYYGYGEAERLLGQVLAGRRDRVTITTKFGIEPSGAVKNRWVNLAARRVLKLAPFVKTLLRRKPDSASNWGIFDPESSARSLDRSLQALQTDYIDLFLLHEPSPGSAASEPLIEFLEREVQRGRIRAYGCGGEWKSIGPIAAAGLPTSRWLQFEDNAINRRIETARASGARSITFAPFNNALKILAGWLDERPAERGAWSKELGVDCGDKEVLAGLLQASCHARNADGIVLFSSKNPERIKQAVRIASGETFTKDQVSKFLDLTKETRAEAQRR
jgi:aryl-alcohol dehydrogenase-like predicted oxidoreductase